jgi:uncharacterized membrane protein YfcA
MDITARTCLVLSVLFLSAFARSALGFGDALLAMPLLALIVGIGTATPLVALAASTIAVTILLRAWRQVDVKATWRLIVSTFVGIPLGLTLLKTAPEGVVKGMLGVVLIGFGMYNLIKFQLPKLKNERLSYLFGFVAGVLGGAYNTNGPPVVIYGVMREWSPERFRATLQGYFLITGGTILISHGIAGMWTPEVLRLYVCGLPVIIGGVVIGGCVHHKATGEQFKWAVNTFLVVMGVLMFL